MARLAQLLRKKRLLADLAIIIIYAIIVLSFPELVVSSFDFLSSEIILFSILGVVDYLIKTKYGGDYYPLRARLTVQRFQSIVSVLDEEYSKIFSAEFVNIVPQGINVYLFQNDGRRPPVFSDDRKSKPDIYVDDRLPGKVDSSFLRFTILHELGHYIRNDLSKRINLVKAMLLSIRLQHFPQLC